MVLSAKVKVYSAKFKKKKKIINSLSANPKKWSNTFKQFVDELFECVWPFCEIGAKINWLIFPFFFLPETFFPKRILKDPGK